MPSLLPKNEKATAPYRFFHLVYFICLPFYKPFNDSLTFCRLN